MSTRATCACGMPLFPAAGTIPTPHTIEWHELHRDRHLAAFPDVDDVTRRNLDDLIAWAQHRAGAQTSAEVEVRGAVA